MWHHLYIDDPTVAFVTSDKMKQSTLAVLRATKNYDAALFSRLDIETGGVHFYFAPGAVAIAKAFKASPCEKPTRTTAGGLLSGDQGAIARLFPGEVLERR